ncbi:hypothetical protein GF339_20455, partial [candidate division KSB3 bacterium]|nr:hypothetical protein [candidate division KSB3 bacterium]MBD3326969.1 hypothetical protein [candidate division KSB3 bacterium]
MVGSLLLLLFVLIFGCYVPIYALFHDHSRPVTLAHLGMYTTLGVASLGVLTICAKAAGIDMKAAILPGMLLSIYVLIRDRRACVPQLHLPEYPLHTGLGVGIAGIYFLYTLAQGLVKGTGAYPAMFFELDVAYYLGQIHALIRNDGWPVLSLNNLGVVMRTHYGAQSSCAILSVLTGFPPHTILFLIYMPLMALGVISAAWLIIREYISPTSKPLIWLGMLVLLFGTSFYPLDRVLFTISRMGVSVPAVKNFVRMFFDPDLFGFLTDFHLIPSSFSGIALVMIFLYGFQNLANTFRRRLVTFTVGILIAFKAPYFLTVGAGYGVWVLCEMARTRQIKLFFSPAIALCIAIGINLIAAPAQHYTFIFVPGRFLMDQKFIATLGTLLLLGGLAILAVPNFMTIFKKTRAWSYWIFILLPLIFTNLVSTTLEGFRFGGNIFNQDLFQVCTLIPLFLAMFVFVMLQATWEKEFFVRRYLAVFVLVLLLLIPASHKLLHAVLPVFAPQAIRAESIQNHPLAEALAAIPVEGSIIATN